MLPQVFPVGGGAQSGSAASMSPSPSLSMPSLQSSFVTVALAEIEITARKRSSSCDGFDVLTSMLVTPCASNGARL